MRTRLLRRWRKQFNENAVGDPNTFRVFRDDEEILWQYELCVSGSFEKYLPPDLRMNPTSKANPKDPICIWFDDCSIMEKIRRETYINFINDKIKTLHHD